MNVVLFAHSQLSEKMRRKIQEELGEIVITNGQAISFTAIRTCYSYLKPSEILIKEYNRYFNREATDGLGGTDADRLFRMINNSGHTSTLEHTAFTFAIEGVTRSLLAQLTRHRVGFSYSVMSQRYVRLESESKSGGFDYEIPPSIASNSDAKQAYEDYMRETQSMYNLLRRLGIPAEDARMVLPNATHCNLLMTGNITSLLSFYSKRRKGSGAQWEIANLAEAIRREIVEVEPWLDPFFEMAWYKPKGKKKEDK